MIYRIVWARVVAALQRGRADTISIKPPKILSDEGSASMSETSTIRTIPRSRHDPKIPGRYDAKVVGD
jgi:hypothetical protein